LVREPRVSRRFMATVRRASLVLPDPLGDTPLILEIMSEV